MRRFLPAVTLALLAAACGGSTVPTTTTTVATTSTVTLAGFPVTVTAANGEVTMASRPDRVVSLSSTATEMLFAIGAGPQVAAVDEYSVYPPEAPVTDLSGFTPNLEAIVAHQPDLVVISYDPGELIAGLEAAGIPTLLLPTAGSLDDSYAQIEVLGAATGNLGEAASVVAGMQTEIASIVAESDLPPGITIYHEVDPTLYAASSASFIGQVYSLLGLVNIADDADPDGFGFPQLSAEYVVAADPDVIFLADASMGVTAETLAERPGWDGIAAVRTGSVVVVDEYLASNWGPRVVELLRLVAGAVAALPVDA